MYFPSIIDSGDDDNSDDDDDDDDGDNDDGDNDDDNYDDDDEDDKCYYDNDMRMMMIYDEVEDRKSQG